MSKPMRCGWCPITTIGSVAASATASSHSSCSSPTLAVVVSGHRRVEQGDGQAVELDLLVARSTPSARRCSRGCRERRTAARRTAGGSSPRRRRTRRRRPSAVRSPLAITAANGVTLSISTSSATAARFITSGYGVAPGATRRIGPSSLEPDAAGLGLAEVDVVDRGEPGPQPAGRRWQRLVTRCRSARTPWPARARRRPRRRCRGGTWRWRSSPSSVPYGRPPPRRTRRLLGPRAGAAQRDRLAPPAPAELPRRSAGATTSHRLRVRPQQLDGGDDRRGFLVGRRRAHVGDSWTGHRPPRYW